MAARSLWFLKSELASRLDHNEAVADPAALRFGYVESSELHVNRQLNEDRTVRPRTTLKPPR
jgi:hypothetical protein